MAAQGSQAVNRALGVLACFTADRSTISLKELTELTGLTMPTSHRMVKALEQAGFLVQDSISGRYSLGPAVMRLARVILQRDEKDELVAIALPHIARLRSVSGETVALHVAVGRERICLYELVSRQPMRMASGVGQAYPLHLGAVGKSILALLPTEMIEEYIQDGLEVFTERSLSNPASLRKALNGVRARGYATSFGETIEGASALAVPILDSAGSVAASMNITGPDSRWNRKRMTEVLPIILASAEEISRHLGFDGQPPWGSFEEIEI